MILLIVLSIVLLIALFIFVLTIGVNWSVHKEMTISNSKIWGYGNANNFIREFKKYEWDNHRWSGSFFNDKSNSKIHADIFKFDGVGMVMKNPWQYVMVVYYLKAQSKYAKEKYDWSSFN